MSEKLDIEKMTVSELREAAKALGIAGTSGMKKAELGEAIAAAQGGGGKAPTPSSRPSARKDDLPALKAEKRSLRALIAEAVKAKDVKLTSQLRSRKREIRRILNARRPS